MLETCYLHTFVLLLLVRFSAPLTPEQEEIHSLVAQHVLNQANIPVSFRMQSPSTPFIGRVSEISEIKWAHVDQKMVVLTGPHGVGKSELAKKYAQDFKIDNVSSTLWINSETHLSVRDAFKDLAITVGISTENEKDTTTVRNVIKHFKNRKTLFIFDNAKYKNIFVNNMPAWIGESEFINVIVTSRDEGWNQNKFRIIKIKPFNLQESIKFVKLSIAKDIHMEIDDESIKQLSEVLRYNPQALSDAVKEIVKHNLLNPAKVYTINDFIETYKNKPIETVIQIRDPTGEEIEDAIQNKIKLEWQRAGDSITNEAKRFSKRVGAEYDRFEDRVKKWFG